MEHTEIPTDPSPNKENVATAVLPPPVDTSKCYSTNNGHTNGHNGRTGLASQLPVAPGLTAIVPADRKHVAAPPQAAVRHQKRTAAVGAPAAAPGRPVGLLPNILKNTSSNKKWSHQPLISQTSPNRMPTVVATFSTPLSPSVVLKGLKNGHQMVGQGVSLDARRTVKAKAVKRNQLAGVARATQSLVAMCPSAVVHHDHSALARPKQGTPAAAAVGQPPTRGPSTQQPSADQLVESVWNNYIGDLDRTWALFEKLDDAATANNSNINAELLAAVAKSEQFMSRLDRWGDDGLDQGVDDDDHHRQLPFSGFLGANHTRVERELVAQGVPADWADAELFDELDRRHQAESVFLKKWLPKCAPMPRNDAYRTFLRELNKRDPAFNILW